MAKQFVMEEILTGDVAVVSLLKNNYAYVE
jgi:hypothetical protein